MSSRITRLVENVATLAFIGFFVAVCAQVIYRYLGLAIVFSEEAARLLNIYAVFIGALAAFMSAAHIRIDIIDRVAHRGRWGPQILAVLYDLLFVLFAIVFGIGSFSMLLGNWNVPLATIGGLDSWVFYLPAVIFSAGICIAALGRLISSLRQRW